MKKIILLVALVFASYQSFSQIHVGLKAGVNYNSNSFQDVTNDVLDGAQNLSGYHAGLWMRFKIPVIGLYLRPELVYTELNNDVPLGTVGNQVESNFKFRTFDIPVLVGTKILKIANVYVGPSFRYVIDSDFSLNTISDVSTDDFTVGLQFGGGIEIGKLGLDVRWERAFKDVESNAISSGNNINFDTRINQIIVGLSYRF